MSIKSDFALGAGGAIVLGVVAYLIWKKAQTTGAFDPTNPNNAAYSAVNAFGAKLTNNPDFNLGSGMFEWFNPGALAAERAAIYGMPPARAPERVINPSGASSGVVYEDTELRRYYADPQGVAPNTGAIFGRYPHP